MTRQIGSGSDRNIFGSATLDSRVSDQDPHRIGSFELLGLDLHSYKIGLSKITKL